MFQATEQPPKKDFLKSTANFGCYNYYGRKLEDNYLPNKNFTINDVLNSAVSFGDKAWFIQHNNVLSFYSEFLVHFNITKLVIEHLESNGYVIIDLRHKQALIKVDQFLSDEIDRKDLEKEKNDLINYYRESSINHPFNHMVHLAIYYCLLYCLQGREFGHIIFTGGVRKLIKYPHLGIEEKILSYLKDYFNSL